MVPRVEPEGLLFENRFALSPVLRQRWRGSGCAVAGARWRRALLAEECVRGEQREAGEAELQATLNPGNLETSFAFEYTSQESFEAEGFAGAAIAGSGLFLSTIHCVMNFPF